MGKEHTPAENAPFSEIPSKPLQYSFPGSLFSGEAFQSSFPNCVPGNTSRLIRVFRKREPGGCSAYVECQVKPRVY